MIRSQYAIMRPALPKAIRDMVVMSAHLGHTSMIQYEPLRDLTMGQSSVYYYSTCLDIPG